MSVILSDKFVGANGTNLANHVPPVTPGGNWVHSSGGNWTIEGNRANLAEDADYRVACPDVMTPRLGKVTIKMGANVDLGGGTIRFGFDNGGALASFLSDVTNFHQDVGSVWYNEGLPPIAANDTIVLGISPGKVTLQKTGMPGTLQVPAQVADNPSTFFMSLSGSTSPNCQVESVQWVGGGFIDAT